MTSIHVDADWMYLGKILSVYVHFDIMGCFTNSHFSNMTILPDSIFSQIYVVQFVFLNCRPNSILKDQGRIPLTVAYVLSLHAFGNCVCICNVFSIYHPIL